MVFSLGFLNHQQYALEKDTGTGSILTTPQKINIEPENDGLEDDFPFPEVYSQVPS